MDGIAIARVGFVRARFVTRMRVITRADQLRLGRLPAVHLPCIVYAIADGPGHPHADAKKRQRKQRDKYSAFHETPNASIGLLAALIVEDREQWRYCMFNTFPTADGFVIDGHAHLGRA